MKRKIFRFISVILLISTLTSCSSSMIDGDESFSESLSESFNQALNESNSSDTLKETDKKKGNYES